MSTHPLLRPPIPVQSNAVSTGTGGITGKGFQPGQSGNPRGRPKGLARKVRETLGKDDGEALVGFWAAVLSGRLTTIEADGKRTVEKVDMKDRIAVSKLLAERGWGKPPMYAPMEDDDPLDLADRDVAEIALSFERRVDELAARRQAHAAAADG